MENERPAGVKNSGRAIFMQKSFGNQNARKSSQAGRQPPLFPARNFCGRGSPEGAEVQTCTLFSPLWALFGTFLSQQKVTFSPPQRRREQRIKSRWMLKSISCKISPKHRVTACAAQAQPNPSEHIVGIRKRREFLRLRVLKAQPQLKRRIPALWANRRMQGNRRGRLPVIQHIRIAVASAVKKRNVAVWLMKRNAKHAPHPPKADFARKARVSAFRRAECAVLSSRSAQSHSGRGWLCRPHRRHRGARRREAA